MTHADAQQRRSRLAWPTRTAPTTTPAGTHDHAQSNGPLALAFICIVLLFLVNAVLLWFIVARGETRDAREQQMRQDVRDELCKFLGLQPAEDPLADVYRAELDCAQPGRPAEAFPPGVLPSLPGAPARPIEPSAAPAEPERPPAPSPGGDEPPPTAPPAGQAPPATPALPAAPPPPAAPPEPPPSPPPTPPLVDLEPVTDPLCAVLDVCL